MFVVIVAVVSVVVVDDDDDDCDVVDGSSNGPGVICMALIVFLNGPVNFVVEESCRCSLSSSSL